MTTITSDKSLYRDQVLQLKDRTVESISSTFQEYHPDGGADPVGRCDYAECAIDLRPSGERIGIDIEYACSLAWL